jgi:uncharacterized protein (TIGR03435 family)
VTNLGSTLAALVAILSAPNIFAQVPEAFDIVSIKRNLTDGDRPMRTSLTPGRLAYPNTTVRGIIMTAFGVNNFQISGGPAWLRTDRYDIVAKIDSADTVTLDQLRPMLRSMLAGRFQLKFRRETEDLPRYALVAAKNGPKLKENTGAQGLPLLISGDATTSKMTCTGVSMAYLAKALENQFAFQFGRTVVDLTGLKGNFDFTLSWTRDQANDAPGSSLLTALQEQLGLKLESQKGPVETIYIDSIERPSVN